MFTLTPCWFESDAGGKWFATQPVSVLLAEGFVLVHLPSTAEFFSVFKWRVAHISENQRSTNVLQSVTNLHVSPKLETQSSKLIGRG